MTFFDVKIDMFLFLSYIILTLADRTLSKFYLKKMLLLFRHKSPRVYYIAIKY